MLFRSNAEDATVAAQKALAAVQRLGGRFGKGRVVDHLLGKTKDVSGWEAGLSTWGIGGELSANAWRDLIDQLLFEGLLDEDPNDGRPLVTLGDAGEVKRVYRGELKVEMRRLERAESARAPKKRTPREPMEAVKEEDRLLFGALREWRKETASAQGVPPYVVFHDRTLLDIAKARPESAMALGRIGGVGEGKLARYGAAVLKVVREN